MNRFPLFRTLTTAVLLAGLSACGGGGSDGEIFGDGPIIIGTGSDIRGTVPTNRQFADSTVAIRSASGEMTTGSIGSNGRFNVDGVLGDSPYLLRVDLGNNEAYFSVAHSSDTTSITQNVHGYSDLAIRNWFATQGLDVEAAFNSTGPIQSLPSAAEIAAIDTRIFDVLSESLAAYGLSGTNLSTVSFDSDDLGVDFFLDRNPVLINNGTITIIITEPTDDTQAIVAEGLPIDTDLTAPDNVPPSAPTGLRVLPSASNEIVVVWESARDNIAVSGYEVLRDGVVVETTAFPLFIDSPLDSGVTFNYNIVAIDAAGNRSSLSEPGSSQTLAAPDTVAPPVATDLAFVTSNNSIVVRWTQSNISDVASFRVLRGIGSTMLDQVAVVTSTALVDGGLNSGIEYCYQIITTDASINESGPSAIACATTDGTNLVDGSTGGGVTTPPVAPPTNTPADPGSLLAVDVSGLSCETVLETTTIASVVTLDAPCLRVTDDIRVNQGGQLVVAAGTVLKFESGNSVFVTEGGSLTVNGTVAQPVVFSALDPTPGIWGGIEYDRSNSSRNSLNNMVIEFGGQPTGAGLETIGFSFSQVRISVNNVLVRGSNGDGIELSADTIVGEFNGFISTNNARSATVPAVLAANFGPDSQLSGNTQDGLTIVSTAVNAATVWQKIDVPFLLDTLDVDAPLSIAAGSELRFQSGGNLIVSEDGSLSAIGTESEVIRFTGLEMSPGFWTGIQFDRSNSTNNRLEHTVVEYAGGVGTDNAGVSMRAFSFGPARLALVDTVLQFNQGPGFRFSSEVIIPEFSNVRSTGNSLSGVIAPATIPSLGANLDFQGNTQDGLRVLDGTLSTAATWPAVNVPYLFNELDLAATLTVSAGASFIADAGATINVSEEGALNAVGTAAMPISFVGSQPIIGHWNGIDLNRSSSVLNVFDFVTLSNGGGGASATSANINITCFSFSPVQLTISNSTVSNSAGFGIYGNTEECSAVNLGANVTFTGNVLADIGFQQ